MVMLKSKPVPVRLIDWGESPALSVSTIVPVRVPAKIGVNETVIVQVALAAIAPLQVVVSLKSAVDAEGAMLEIMRGPTPLFVRVIVWVELGLFTIVVGKVRVAGERLTTDWVPIPEIPAD
jgi:hypothetical protein